jgi:hypothetical protein
VTSRWFKVGQHWIITYISEYSNYLWADRQEFDSLYGAGISLIRAATKSAVTRPAVKPIQRAISQGIQRQERKGEHHLNPGSRFECVQLYLHYTLAMASCSNNRQTLPFNCASKGYKVCFLATHVPKSLSVRPYNNAC